MEKANPGPQKDTSLQRELTKTQTLKQAGISTSEMLKANKEAGLMNEGGRPAENPLHDDSGLPPKLSDMGITHSMSSRLDVPMNKTPSNLSKLAFLPHITS